MGLQKRIGDLVASVSAGMFEREEIIAVSLLGALCGQNTFLYGPPGTAKSLISRRIACAIEQPTEEARKVSPQVLPASIV